MCRRGHETAQGTKWAQRRERNEKKAASNANKLQPIIWSKMCLGLIKHPQFVLVTVSAFLACLSSYRRYVHRFSHFVGVEVVWCAAAVVVVVTGTGGGGSVLLSPFYTLNPLMWMRSSFFSLSLRVYYILCEYFLCVMCFKMVFFSLTYTVQSSLSRACRVYFILLLIGTPR